MDLALSMIFINMQVLSSFIFQHHFPKKREALLRKSYPLWWWMFVSSKIITTAGAKPYFYWNAGFQGSWLFDTSHPWLLCKTPIKSPGSNHLWSYDENATTLPTLSLCKFDDFKDKSIAVHRSTEFLNFISLFSLVHYFFFYFEGRFYLYLKTKQKLRGYLKHYEALFTLLLRYHFTTKKPPQQLFLTRTLHLIINYTLLLNNNKKKW